MTQERLAALLRTLIPREGGSAETHTTQLEAALVTSVSRRIGPGPTAWALQEAAGTWETVKVSFPDAPDLPRREITLSLETLLLDLLAVLIDPGSPRLAPSSTPPMAQLAARRDVPVVAIMDGMRKVQGKWLTKLIGEAGASALEWSMTELLMSTGGKIFDEEINRFVAAYLAERERLLESHLARRRSAVEALIVGERLDPARAEEDLCISLQQFHVGMVFSFARSVSGQQREQLVRHAARQLHKASVLVLPEDRDRLWAWVSGPTPPTADALRGLDSPVGPSLVTGWSIGQPAFGPEGFRRTHLQARDIQALSALAQPQLPTNASAGVRPLLWEDHALSALLGQSVERAFWFVQAVLGPLAEDSSSAEELRRTLLTYLDSGLSLIRTGQSRNVHRNTVVYRVQRIEELLAHRVKDRALELHCALLLAGHFGAAVLRSPHP